MSKILFLDIDGVMNYTKAEKEFKEECERSYKLPWKEVPLIEQYRVHHPSPRAIKTLNNIIEDTDCKIVISSSWRHDFSLMGWNHFFASCGIIPAVIDKTPSLKTYRGTEIFSWILSYTDTHWKTELDTVDSFAVLDDDWDPVYTFINDRWILTETDHGLDIEHQNAAVNILNNMPFDINNFKVAKV